MEDKTVWETLNNIDVTPYIKKKGKLDYLPWSIAMGLVKPYYPDVSYTLYKDERGCLYHTDGKTCWVEVGVTIQGQECIEYLPIMNYVNKAITVDEVTSMDANKAIKRATVKALAQHGLGIKLYSHEDLPTEPTEPKKPIKITAEQSKQIRFLIDNATQHVDMDKLLSFAGVQSIEDIKDDVFPQIVSVLKLKQ